MVGGPISATTEGERTRSATEDEVRGEGATPLRSLPGREGTTRDIGRLVVLFMVFAICCMIKLNIVTKGEGGGYNTCWPL